MMSVTPHYLRLCRRAGIPLADIAAVTGQPLEALELMLAASVTARPKAKPVGKMMTPLLSRPDMEQWEMRRAER